MSPSMFTGQTWCSSFQIWTWTRPTQPRGNWTSTRATTPGESGTSDSTGAEAGVLAGTVRLYSQNTRASPELPDRGVVEDCEGAHVGPQVDVEAALEEDPVVHPGPLVPGGGNAEVVDQLPGRIVTVVDGDGGGAAGRRE